MTAKRGQTARVFGCSGGRGKTGGLSAVARDIGVDRKELRTAMTVVANTTPEAKQAIRDAGLNNNASAMLRVAGAPPEQQVELVWQIAEAKKERRRPAPPEPWRGVWDAYRQLSAAQAQAFDAEYRRAWRSDR